MLHGGALDYGSSKQPTTTLAALAWHPLRVHKQSGFDSRLRPQIPNRLRSSNVEQAALNRRVVSSSLTGGTRGSSMLPYADDILPGTLRPQARRSPCRGITGSQGKQLFEVWLNGRARRLGRWDWRFDSSHLDDVHGHREPCR